MKKRVLILGAGVMQGPAIRIAKRRGWEVVVADADPTAPCAGEADRFERVDLKDKESMEALARSLMGTAGGLAGVFTAGTDFSATVAWVAERLGLPGIPYEVALDASDKSRMRERFRAAGVPSPDFVVRRRDEPFGPPPFAFPAVVKPVDNMGSRGCRRVDSESQLRSALDDAFRYSRSGRAIVEEYMEGPEFSVDSLMVDGNLVLCGLADRHIFFPPYFIEMGHTIPSALEPTAAGELLSVFERGVRALGIRTGAAKGDVKLTPKGPMIGEIAARLSGGYMSGWTYPLASGVEPTDAALSLAVGEQALGLEPKLSRTCAERAFISIPGTLRELRGVDAARSAPGVAAFFLRASPGAKLRFPENNVSKCGNVIAVADGRADAAAAAEGAARAVLLRLSPGDLDTDAFLAAAPGTCAFPPDAYVCGPEMLGALGDLPEGSLTTGSSGGPAVPAAARSLRLASFPAFADSGLLDYQGRSVRDALASVESLTGTTLRFVAPSEDPELGRGFWRAFVRGGYQGGAYVIDSLLEGRGGPTA